MSGTHAPRKRAVAARVLFRKRASPLACAAIATEERRRAAACAPASKYDAPACVSILPTFFFDFWIAARPAARRPSLMLAGVPALL